jgi:hypothetical protein
LPLGEKDVPASFAEALMAALFRVSVVAGVPTAHIQFPTASNAHLQEKFYQLRSTTGAVNGVSGKLLLLAAILHPIKSEVLAAVNAGTLVEKTVLKLITTGLLVRNLDDHSHLPVPAVGKLVRHLVTLNNNKANMTRLSISKFSA